jgi:hypothetical protein
MEWIKIFPNETVARTSIQEHIPQLIIVEAHEFVWRLHEGKFFAVQDNALIMVNHSVKDELTTEEKSCALSRV